jgi:hypothetical protein
LRLKKILKRDVVRVRTTSAKIPELSEIASQWETTIYFTFQVEKDFLLQENFLGISKFPYIIKEINHQKYSVSSFRSIWKIKRKKREIENVQISYDGVQRANQISFKLSSQLFKINADAILSEKTRLLEDVGCATFEEYFKKIKKIFKDEAYSYKLFKETKNIAFFFNGVNIDTKNKKCITTNFDLYLYIKKERINLLTNFQKLISMELLNKDIFDRPIYLPCFADVRGRQYYASLISPTFYTLFRHLYEFTFNKNFAALENSEFYITILKYKFLLERYQFDIKECYVALVLFIEVGKFFLKNTDYYIIKTTDIIQAGIKNYESRCIDVEFKDLLYVRKIYNALDKLIIDKIIDNNIIIYKDATASGLQNYGILLGYNKHKLEYLNLNGEDWCDTYSYLIHKFLKEEIGLFSKRKY